MTNIEYIESKIVSKNVDTQTAIVLLLIEIAKSLESIAKKGIYTKEAK